MRVILNDIPLGKRKTEIGIILRQEWFITGCFFNGEVWTGTKDADLKALEVIDHSILCLITAAQAKVPVEMLYLETSHLPILNVISVKKII